MLKRVLVAAAVLVATPAVAMDMSFLTGIYQSSKQKVEGEKGIETSSFDIGARVSDQLDTNLMWIGQGGLEIQSYSAPSGGKAPGNSTSLSAGGGMRYYFGKWSESATPYLQGIGQFKQSKSADINGTAGYTEHETSGLFYGADLGVRFGLDMDFFVDFEASLFESALFATTETVEYDVATDTKTESETTNIALHGSSTGAFDSLKIALGMKF